MGKKDRHSMEPRYDDEIGGRLSPKAISRQEFGRRLHSLILSSGMNQSDLSRATGIGKDSISGYIRGRSFPGPNNLRAIEQALGVTREVLLPNSIASAMDEELPALDLKQAVGHPDRVWLRVNRSMSMSAAAKIITIIKEDDEQYAGYQRKEAQAT